MKRSMALVALIALLASACASMRKVDVTSDPNSTYRISVHNTRAGVVSVSYSDGTTTRQLGDVGGGDTMPFVVVASPNSPRITLMARTSGGTALPSQSVNLSPGQTTSVTIH